MSDPEDTPPTPPSDSPAPPAKEPAAPETAAAPPTAAVPPAAARPAPPKPPAAPLDPAAAEAAAKAKAEAAAKAAEAAAAKAAAEAAKPVWERDAVLPTWSDSSNDPLVAALRERHGEAIVSARSMAGDLTVVVARERIADVVATLKSEHGYTYLIDVCGCDFPKKTPRFEVVYHLHQFPSHRRIRLKVGVAEGEEVPTLTGVFRAANWPERETFDMLGLRFSGHPDLSRILTWEGFNGHPLRKDFPVEGIDTGAAIYPEQYGEGAGPISKAGTGWLVKDATPPPEEPQS
jgi:NADH-quinone oxidoreductase subunit C